MCCRSAHRRKAGKTVVRTEGRQILVLNTERGIFACANRCPHEGYPLSEAVLTDGCVLTCNWHNWKFDLATGETLVGGDALPRFPVRVQDGRVWLDITPPDPAVRRQQILAGLPRALQDNDVQRLVREAARLSGIGADPLDALREAVAWSAERLEFGTTHALAGAPDWLALFDAPASGPDQKLAALGEILGHIADDARGGRQCPLAGGQRGVERGRNSSTPWMREDEAAAVARLRGALAVGLEPADLLPALCAAALAHYADFGHSLIYAVKTAALARRIGAADTLLPMLARSLIYATREDLLPEFRDYAAHLAAWGKAGKDGAPPLDGRGAAGQRRAAGNDSDRRRLGSAYPAEVIFPVLVEAAAWNAAARRWRRADPTRRRGSPTISAGSISPMR